MTYKESFTEIALEELSKQPEEIIQLAYVYAINYDAYGVDVTQSWETATLNQSILHEAYNKGIHDALQKCRWDFDDYLSDWLSTFNTDSATECFTAVQELKKRLEGDDDKN